MESGKQSVRLLMQKERERRERLRRQAAAAAFSAVQQDQPQQDADDLASPLEAEAREKLITAPSSLPSEQARQAVSPAVADSRVRAKQELPADFFDAAVCAPFSTPQLDIQVALSSGAEAAAADVSAAHVVTDVVEPPAVDKGEGDAEALEEEEEEEGVIFEIEEPDASLLLPVHAQSPSESATMNFGREKETEQSGDTTFETAGLSELEKVSLFSQTAAAPAGDISDIVSEAKRRVPAGEMRDTEGHEQAGAAVNHTTDSPSVQPAAVSAATPSAVTSALLASATGDELRWYRPFDTAFHSELLHEEEELAQLQREAQVAAEKRAAAAREAASAAAAAAVAAAAAASADADTRKKKEASGVSGLTKHQLAKRKAAAEATAAAAAAAEAAASAAAAAAEKHAAATDALLGKAQAVKAARQAQQRQKLSEDAPVPWGFFDDEEREAAMRGLTGPKRLQELLRRAEERRRDMAEDLQERKQDWLRHREDVRRFVLRVEEQVQDASLYQMRVERLKKKRKTASADVECTTDTATNVEAPTVTETRLPQEIQPQTAEEPSATATHVTLAKRETDGGEVASADIKQELTRGIKSERKSLSYVGEDKRKTTPRDSTSSVRRGSNSNIPLDPDLTSPSSQKADFGVVKMQHDEDTKQKLIASQLLAAATAGSQVLQAKQEMLQNKEAEQLKSLQAGASPLEDGGSDFGGEDHDEDFSGDEDDDSRWRAKSLLATSSVPDM